MTTDLRPGHAGTPGEVFAAFLELGLTSFGGPIAHLGYFRDKLVTRRKWLTEPAYAELVALCQFLPGPASSQVGLALGLARAGPLGALAAWTAFTLPSAVLMLLLALVSGAVTGPTTAALFHGLKLVAVVIVAQAVWGMAQTLTPDFRRITIAALAAAILFVVGGEFGQIGAIMCGAAAGLLFCRHLVPNAGAGVPIAIPRRAGRICLTLFAALLIALPIIAAATGWRDVQLFGIFYRAGALVFGGGHVVLPLLRADLVPDLISDDRFLAAYGAAQTLPGPLFAISAFLGAAANNPVSGALLALVGIFLPGMLILVGVLPFWARLRDNVQVRSAIVGVNAAVVGILVLALYDPLWTSTVASWRDVAMIGIALFAALKWRPPPLVVVAGLVAVSLVIGTG